MGRSAAKITFLYVLFACLSTLINIGSQMLSMLVYGGSYAIEVSIFIGTLVALPLKYLLDKRHIFQFQSNNVQHDGQLFFLYSLMGIITTFIFWFTEYGFHLLFTSNLMRYIGGILGLSLGYFIKYQLDKRFVFISKSAKELAI